MKYFYHEIDLNKSNIIYKLQNRINKKLYIGQTTLTMRQRLYHYHRLAVGQLLKRAILKYGFEKFELSIVEECFNINHLNNKEKYWIKYFNSTDPKNGYNLQKGGNNKTVHPATRKLLAKLCSGWKHTEKAKKKISESQKGNKHWSTRQSFTDESRKKMSESHKGKPSSRKGKKGFIHTAETKKKMSIAQKGRVITWGDKITKAKTKFHKQKIIELIRKNPDIKLKNIMKYFGMKTHFGVLKYGGLKKLRIEATL